MSSEELSGAREDQQDGPDANVVLAVLTAEAVAFEESALDMARLDRLNTLAGCRRHGGWTGGDARTATDLVLHGHCGVATALSDRLREAA
jgi:hypothetical protein